MSEKILILCRHDDDVSDLVSKLSVLGFDTLVNCRIDHAIVAINDKHARPVLIMAELSRHPDVFEFLRTANQSKRGRFVTIPIILFRLAPIYTPNELAMHEFVEKNFGILNIAQYITLSEITPSKLASLIRRAIDEFTVASGARP